MTVSHLSEYLCRLHRLIGVGWSWKKLSHQSSSDVDDDVDGDGDDDDGDGNNENEEINLKIWHAILQKKNCITILNCPLCHLPFAKDSGSTTTFAIWGNEKNAQVML